MKEQLYSEWVDSYLEGPKVQVRSRDIRSTGMSFSSVATSIFVFCIHNLLNYSRKIFCCILNMVSIFGQFLLAKIAILWFCTWKVQQ